jgi:cysteine synthase A
MAPHPDAASLIGRTPVVELRRLTRGLRGALYAKLEFLNPGGSKKDRIARQMIDDALADGRLRPGQPVVELTSGNTGTGLAIVCAARGLPFTAVMSAGNSPERRRMMEAFGAEVEIVPQAPGSPPGQVSGLDLALVEKRAAELAAARGAFRPDQFTNPSNVRAHEEGTAREIWDDLGGRVTAFCDFVGSAGTLVGVARGLKRRDPRIRCLAVEPAGAAVLAGSAVTRPNHRIQGGGYALERPPLWDASVVDGFLAVTDEEAIRRAHELARREGLFAGFSSGANVAAAMKLIEAAQGDPDPARVVVLLNDSGLKYLSTDLWE